MKCGDYMNEQNNNDVYHDNNSYNNQGMDNTRNEPTTGQTLGNMANSGINFAKGINNLKNNPALGLKKPKDNNSRDKKDGKNNNDNQNNNNPTKGQRGNNNQNNKNENDKNNNNNLMPGAKKNDNNKKPNNTNKPTNDMGNKNKMGGIASKINPMKKSSHGKASGEKKASATSGLSKLTQKGLKTIWMALPIHIKLIAIGVAIIPILILGLIAFFAIFGATVAATTVAMCGETSYNVNGADATAFLCNMQSPFGNAGFTVTSTSGWRIHPISGGGKFHYGTDVVGSGDKSIYAVQDGVIKSAGWNGGYGNSILISHDDKYYTRYAHLSSFDPRIKAGAEVKAGDKIGTEGTTGNSTGIHLHFELLDENMNYLSANPFFGYSDQGYEECVDPDAAFNSKCSFSVSKKARHIGQEGFNQICGRTSNYTNGGGNDGCCNDGSNSESDILSFIKTFEGSGGYCDAAKTLYKAYQNSGDRVTIGYGVTSDYIPGLKIGDCRSVAEVDAAKMTAIDNKRSFIQKTFSETTLTTYQEDAMTSMAYNGCGGFFDDIAKAAKDGSYEKVWSEMKGCTNNGMLGLERRRKAEFALYVTGDYSIAKEYKTKTWTAAEYDDYDSDNIIAQKATGSSSSCTTVSGDKQAVVERALQEYDNWHSSPKNYCSNISKYLASCGYNGGKGGNDEYCAGFVTYILKEAGVAESIGLPNYTCVVSNFKNTKNGTVHKAGGSYIPEPGDIMIVRGWGHIVLVEKVEGKRVHYIGGNEGGNSWCNQGKVNKGSFSLTSSYITAYVSY